ncbi:MULTISPECIES: serine endopeptidase [Pandoraea]|uniref:serine endopeptidase n=1 Tax=Pandoraea TaxID=93217 RepID=UPI001F5D6665|nr:MULTISPECIES: serine endopeptidase [Pandoraea]MCI3204354.1 serine endopeptidase [Pandoraea sp. LA3]MDN4582381.1 serine endopeptidase [Pandoraea capi]
MAGSRRLPETWFRRGLWLIAVLFAAFLIGLGGLVVDKLPGVAAPPTLASFVDVAQAQRADAAIKQAQTQLEDVESQLETARLQLKARSTAYRNARESFNDWVATRTATAQASQDAELISRTRALDTLKAAERDAQTQVDSLESKQLEAQRAVQSTREARFALNEAASEQLAAVQRSQELKVFGIRLALTLPLLAIAGWLFVRQRKSTWWPFVWGFIFFALFAFFVELVPYLPDYGGYVRYLVGIVLTVLIGRYAIVSLQRYLARQKAEEQLPDEERRKTLSYDLAQARLAKSVCPGCERPVKLDDPDRDYCVHCGICLFDHCGTCKTRKNAFAHFCHHCGARSTGTNADLQSHPSPAA